VVNHTQTLTGPTGIEWYNAPFTLILLPTFTPLLPEQKNTSGWQVGVEEAHRMFTEAQHSKGNPLTKQEIREHYSARYFAYIQAWKRGDIADHWVEEWCRAFAFVCLQAEHAASDETITPQAVTKMMKHFGTLVQFLRQRSHVFQHDVITTLALFVPLFPKERYSRLENGSIAPQFDHLAPIYKALVHSGIEIRPEECAAYVLLARKRIEAKATHQEHIPDERWHALAVELACESPMPLQLGGGQ
jgi:hypothetical protein